MSIKQVCPIEVVIDGAILTIEARLATIGYTQCRNPLGPDHPNSSTFFGVHDASSLEEDYSDDNKLEDGGLENKMMLFMNSLLKLALDMQDCIG